MASLTALPHDQVTIAPLVLLSVLDHYKRTETPEGKRVVGVILGDATTSTVKVTNSFALPFEEDDKNSDVWFLDQNYIENMNEMCKKINAKEKLIGWYHSGPKLRASDLKINELFKKYTGQNRTPLLLIVDVQQSGVGLPTDAYISVDQVKDDGTSTERTFLHLPCSVEAEEAEEIGVEHLLRDVRDQAAGGLSIRLTNQLKSLKGLQKKLGDITVYLNKVINKELPVNHIILGKLQDVFNLLPNLGQPNEDEMDLKSPALVASSNTLQKALTIKTNDELMIVYISNLVRAIIAFDDLIENKIQSKKLQEKLQKDAEQSTTEEATEDNTTKENDETTKSSTSEKKKST
ncbi:similar to Saccharomyces cerevisiae YOR261C RPN8 Essential, non-ATPase regulatory subunit of the 26S proteasome [Maudiozyma barnettii]|uniref:26S proteasome regulatory subunit RPN8 n=1 Tax=Maudiozyma barnettii TaxID=61262 RepID=A0A8H2VCF6_9SACH|nr:proteasome regulatory particle lid subunit RPN8 [Kazachstania barnettii]CAB4252696.1 similar to Saccharomyces cerevisiae YOR261C RPN8 Essential, non-ATPase regulatory subunit of the 26S proteasome [Kazachstania barnettii]CAD1780486.1 similar to Saccharomyces cerevisiae YOR261C RPN8 Essential, non-ATPase regulatory subunit of the 26S proteasome [Kazachstania barnettii]